MSSKRPSRRVALLGLIGLAAGCGFAPIYGDGQGQRLGAFDFSNEATTIGFALSGRLSERLGPPDAAQFLITTRLDVSERAAAITADGDTSRLNVVGDATWSVTDIATGQERAAGTVSAFTSYSATGSTIGTQSAQDDARTRLAILLADLIVTRVIITVPPA